MDRARGTSLLRKIARFVSLALVRKKRSAALRRSFSSYSMLLWLRPTFQKAKKALYKGIFSVWSLEKTQKKTQFGYFLRNRNFSQGNVHKVRHLFSIALQRVAVYSEGVKVFAVAAHHLYQFGRRLLIQAKPGMPHFVEGAR